jgi:hypothetical protein
MSDEPKPNNVLTELRNKGHLPALDTNVASVCTLTNDPLTRHSRNQEVVMKWEHEYESACEPRA